MSKHDHEAAKIDADLFSDTCAPKSAIGNLASCYLDLCAKHEELRRLAEAFYDSVYSPEDCEALRAFIEKEKAAQVR